MAQRDVDDEELEECGLEELYPEYGGLPQVEGGELIPSDVTLGLTFGKEFSPQTQGEITRLLARIPPDIVKKIRSVEIDPLVIEYMSRLHGKVYDAYFDPATGKLAFRSIEIATRPDALYHELGHVAIQTKFDVNDLDFFANYIALVEKDRPLAEAVRTGRKSLTELPSGLLEDLADDLADYFVSPALMHTNYPSYAQFIESYFRVPAPEPTFKLEQVWDKLSYGMKVSGVKDAGLDKPVARKKWSEMTREQQGKLRSVFREAAP